MTMISFNNQTKQLEINDNYKARLQSSRIMSAAILVLSIGRISILDYQNLRELDYLFFIIVAVFTYLVYKNFFVLTSLATIDKFEIKYVKMPKAMATKAVIKLNNNGHKVKLYHYGNFDDSSLAQKLYKYRSEIINICGETSTPRDLMKYADA